MEAVMFNVFLAIIGSIVGVWAICKYFVFIVVRVDANTFKTLYEMTKDEKRKFLLEEEFITEAKYPVAYNAVCFFPDAPIFLINHAERLLTAGWSGKDSVTTLTCFRWKYKALRHYLQVKIKEMQLSSLGIPVELITPYYTDKIGILKYKITEPLLENHLWKDIDEEAEEVFVLGTRSKTSALLYGTPGCGKTTMVKYLATKYKVPIKLITFSPDFSNQDLMVIFSQITSKCIVLFEDFDNYFEGRKCIIGGNNMAIKFTFDIILNGLDGVYNTYENVMFIMTANDINKIDSALKNRPSRFKFVRCFGNPPYSIRSKLLPEEWAKCTQDLNLDQIMRLKEYKELDFGLKESLSKLELDLKEEDLQALAYKRYEDRMLNNVEGNHAEDWFHVLKNGKH
jgi:hypothetical protein